jgi:hypothetical protein
MQPYHIASVHHPCQRHTRPSRLALPSGRQSARSPVDGYPFGPHAPSLHSDCGFDTSTGRLVHPPARPPARAAPRACTRRIACPPRRITMMTPRHHHPHPRHHDQVHRSPARRFAGARPGKGLPAAGSRPVRCLHATRLARLRLRVPAAHGPDYSVRTAQPGSESRLNFAPPGRMAARAGRARSGPCPPRNSRRQQQRHRTPRAGAMAAGLVARRRPGRRAQCRVVGWRCAGRVPARQAQMSHWHAGPASGTRPTPAPRSCDGWRRSGSCGLGRAWLVGPSTATGLGVDSEIPLPNKQR